MSDSGFIHGSISEISVAIKDGTHGSFKRINNGIPFLSAKNVTERGLIEWDDSDDCISREDYTAITSTFKPAKNDLLLTIVGSLGRRALFEEAEVAFQRSVAFIRPNPDDVVPKFLFHAISSSHFYRQLVQRSNATAQAGLYLGELAKTVIPIPEKEEQSRIAYVLDTIDEAIAQTEAVIAKLKQVRAGMLHDLLSYGLDEHGQLRDPVAYPDQFKDSPLGLIPSNWEVGPFSEIVTVNPPTPSTGLSPFNSISFIPMQDVDEEGNWVYRQTKELINCSGGYTPFIEGDILFAKITPCMENGKGCHAIDLLNGFGMGSTEFHVLRPKSNTSARFVFHWSLTKSMRIRALAYMTGSAGQQRVEAGFFNHFLIPIPATDEQGLIADVIDGADRQIEASWNELQKLKTLKSGLQDDLLTGRVRVPETIMEGAENA